MIINENPRPSAREVYRALEYGKAIKATDLVRHLCSRENYAHKWQFVSETKPMDWPKDSQKYDIYTDEEGEVRTGIWEPRAKSKSI